MEKLYGLLISLVILFTGVYLTFTNLPVALGGGIILGAIGLSLLYERRVIKERSSILEKTISTTIPVLTELILIGTIILQAGYLNEAVVYLGLVLLLTDLIPRYDDLYHINRSKLLGRISRVIILALGIAVSQFNTFLLFYALSASALIALYDTLVILSEVRSGI